MTARLHLTPADRGHGWSMPRSPKVILPIIERTIPNISRREWAALAIAAARRAGLCEPQVESLRTNLEDEFAMAGKPAGV